METLIEFEHADLGYGRRSVVLRDVNLRITRGEFLGVVGPNGSGKTTLLRTFLRLLRPVSGTVRIGGSGEVRFGYVPQRETVDTLFPIPVGEIVMMGRYSRIGVLRRPGRGDHEAASRALEHVGIGHLAAASYRDLSGGQKQRALIARALATQPDVLVLDEPTNGMDLASEQGLLDLIRRLHVEDRLTVILVSHLLANVANVAPRVAIIAEGRVDEGAREEMLTTEHLSALYGMPVQVREVDGRRVIVTGTPP